MAGALVGTVAISSLTSPTSPLGLLALGLPAVGLTAAGRLRSRRRPPLAARVEGFLRTLEARDRYTASHCSRVATFADLLADELGLRHPRRLRNLRIAALLHDLGKMDVPLSVLHKPERLNDREWEQMREHVEAGARRAYDGVGSAICRIIEQHHERPDGRGYPRGLSGAQICLEARIVAVADAFDAMTSDRPYRTALPPNVALEELRRHAMIGADRQQFDPDVVAALVRRFAEFAALCTGEAARHSSPLS